MITSASILFNVVLLVCLWLQGTEKKEILQELEDLKEKVSE